MSCRTAWQQNIILGIHGWEGPGVVEFELFIGKPSELPAGFLQQHCRPWRLKGAPLLSLLCRLLAVWQRLSGAFPDFATHLARFSYPYDDAKGMEVGGLHQDLCAAFRRLREAGFLLEGGFGMGCEWNPAEQYAYRLRTGAESDDFPVILPNRDRDCYILTSVREMGE